MKKIGILGGTFDPPHIGHVMIANEVLTNLNLDEIWFIPTKIPPHKTRFVTDAMHRVKMLQLAMQDNDRFRVMTDEIDREGISYTIDTINNLRNKYPENEFYFIIGADMVEYLPKWNKIDELIKKVQFVGVNRVNYQLMTDYPIKTVKVPYMEISSTEIKQRIKNNQSLKYYVNEAVISYIKEHQLYEFT